MDSPFETPFSILEDEPEGKYTRVLRPYLEKLIELDAEKPIHANKNNTFDTLKHRINEEKLEYWVSDDDEKDKDRDSDVDNASKYDSTSKSKYKKKEKRKKGKKGKKGIKPLYEPKLSHETQIIQDAELAAKYTFNSQEVVHLRQQMYLSLQARAKSKDQRKLPSEISKKDLKAASITLLGMEPRLKPIYFNKSIDCNKMSFIRYQSRIIDTLFYICLFQQKWKLCFKLFKIIISTFGSDIFQMWTLGVYLLTQLNVSEFETNFEVEWSRVSNEPAPKLSTRSLKNLSFLQNSTLVPMLLEEDIDEFTITVIKRTVATKRQMQGQIIKFIKLLMRTSRNQYPISGGFPEQSYVPNGILEDDNDVNIETEVEDNKSAADIENNSSIDTLNSERKKRSRTEAKICGSDEDFVTGDDDDNNNEEEEPQVASKTIIIHNSEFNPHAETHRPHQQTYLRHLRRHTTPLHRLGSRTRTPTYTLTLLWFLVRSGRIDNFQRIVEPLLLVVPTSTGARVALSEIMAKAMDVGSNIQELNTKEQGDWEACASLEKKMIDLNDSWIRWKDQYTSGKKRMRGVRQYVEYTNVDDFLIKFNEMVEKAIKINKQEIKNCDTNNESESSSDGENDYGNATAYVATSNKDSASEGRDAGVDAGQNHVEDDEEFVEFEDDVETQREMERLMGYAEIAASDGSASESEDEQLTKKEKDDELQLEEWAEDEDDEETQRELDRLMGYAEMVAENSGSDGEEFNISEAEKFDIDNNQMSGFEDAVDYQGQESDSE